MKIVKMWNVFFNPWDASNSSEPRRPIMQGGGNRGRGGGDFNSKLNQFFNNFFNNEKSFIPLVLGFFVLMWLLTGIYMINQNEQGVVTRFGKYNRTEEPGLHFKFQFPVERLYKVQTTTIHKMQVGTSANSYTDDGLMLTGDENIVDIDLEVQWRIKSPRDFLFNMSQQSQTIRATTQSAMREIVGKEKISFVLSTGRNSIEQEVKDLTQQILDSYNSGIEIVLVQMLRADPPKQVIESFRDVQTAKAEKERKINQAQAYQNSILPRAQGEADKIFAEAQAYKSVVVADAEGKASRFNDIYNQYKNSRDITKKRIYLETMEKIMLNNDVVIVEKSSASLLPYFNIDSSQKATPALNKESSKAD